MTIPFPFNKSIILASSSPRRAEILTAVGWPFRAVSVAVDETRWPQEQPVEYVQRLAREKAEVVASEHVEEMILGADTTVVVEGELLGQPENDVDAFRMLNLLKGKWHEVLTGVALVGSNLRTEVSYETTRVRFAEMTEAEINWYVSSGEPNGKAGAYAIQGSAALFIEEVEGDYFNIVGLPIRLVYEMAKVVSK